MAEHEDGCGCSFCARLRSRTVTTADWIAQHSGSGHEGSFTTEPFEHPSGRMYWLVCSCGKKHLTMTDALDA